MYLYCIHREDSVALPLSSTNQRNSYPLISSATLPLPSPSDATAPPPASLYIDVPAQEIVLVKRLDPKPEVFVRMCGVEVKVPVSQDVLYDVIALGLKRNVPHYK